jgi:neurofibromin 1
LSIDILQSQLFILKVLSIVMASRWSQNSASAALAAAAEREALSEASSAPSIHSVESLWQEPAPFDDACVKYILSVMVVFMRQTSVSPPLMLQIRSTDLSFRDYEDHLDITSPPPENPQPVITHTLRNRPSVSSVGSQRVNLKASIPVAATNPNYEKTHMSLVKSAVSVNSLIAKHVGRVVFHISASNWGIVHERLSSKVSYLAAHPESSTDTIDLQLMAHSLMDRQRLVTLLNRE